MDHAHHTAHASHASDAADASMAEVLDLDAEVVGSYLDELTAWARSHTGTVPHTIVDVGAGTGSGTLALARRFEAAELIAIDRSATMLDRLQSAAALRGVAGRVRTVRADLDAGWPAIGTADLAWAASSLHHLAEPGRVLADVHGALNPGGLFVVVEMDGMSRFLPEDVYPGLEERCRAVAVGNGWNSWPNWTSHLERVGFTVVEEHVFDIDVRPAPPAANRLAHRVLSGTRSRMAEQLSSDDLAALDRLLDPDGDEFVLRRDDLAVRSVRTAWAAQRS